MRARRSPSSCYTRPQPIGSTWGPFSFVILPSGCTVVWILRRRAPFRPARAASSTIASPQPPFVEERHSTEFRRFTNLWDPAVRTASSPSAGRPGGRPCHDRRAPARPLMARSAARYSSSQGAARRSPARRGPRRRVNLKRGASWKGAGPRGGTGMKFVCASPRAEDYLCSRSKSLIFARMKLPDRSLVGGDSLLVAEAR